MDLEEWRHNDHIQTLPGGGEQGALKALLFQCGVQGWPAGRPFPARLRPVLALRESTTRAESVPETSPTRQVSEESHVERGPGAKMSAMPRN